MLYLSKLISIFDGKVNSCPKINFSHHSFDPNIFVQPLRVKYFPFVPIVPTLPTMPPTPKQIIHSSITNPPCIIAVPKSGVMPFIHSSVAYPSAPAPNEIAELVPNAINAAFALALATPAITGPKYATPNENVFI